MAEHAAHGELDACTVARLAVCTGLKLIGTTVPKIRHYPVVPSEHGFINICHGLPEDPEVQRIPEADPAQKTLQVGTNAEVAALTGLFGNINSRRQRQERCKPITDQEHNFGWVPDIQKTRNQGTVPNEDTLVRIHARPELINRARDPANPLTGYIECVNDHPNFKPIAHDPGQYIGPVPPRRTIVRIPLLSHYDLPIDIIPSNYETDTAYMNQK
ncbi:MAG TPA: hypothetical protein VLF60_03650 [Candidatus Saccharimonadales bacterium]|nr:hypothetical protein [Candidatus Saccharimonadales bacterium]